MDNKANIAKETKKSKGEIHIKNVFNEQGEEFENILKNTIDRMISTKINQKSSNITKNDIRYI